MACSAALNGPRQDTTRDAMAMNGIASSAQNLSVSAAPVGPPRRATDDRQQGDGQEQPGDRMDVANGPSRNVVPHDHTRPAEELQRRMKRSLLADDAPESTANEPGQGVTPGELALAAGGAPGPRARGTARHAVTGRGHGLSDDVVHQSLTYSGARKTQLL
jgi:hypothetical protein